MSGTIPMPEKHCSMSATLLGLITELMCHIVLPAFVYIDCSMIETLLSLVTELMCDIILPAVVYTVHSTVLELREENVECSSHETGNLSTPLPIHLTSPLRMYCRLLALKY